MKILVVGAGAIGGYLAAKLFTGGHEVSVIARGRTQRAIKERGLRLEGGTYAITARVNVVESAVGLGIQDIVILALKAPMLPDVVESIRVVIGASTVVVPAVNGVPWWFFLKSNVELGFARLNSVDPGGKIESCIPIDAVMGCVMFTACAVVEPGVVKHVSGSRVVVGEPAGNISKRSLVVADVFNDSGLDVSLHNDIRSEIWLKLLGNACLNPASLLVQCTTDILLDDVLINGLFFRIMEEMLEVGKKIGLTLDVNPSQRLAMSRSMGKIKTSMLQDVELGKPVEVEAILGAINEVAKYIGHPIPYTSTLYYLARARAQVLGLLVQN